MKLFSRNILAIIAIPLFFFIKPTYTFAHQPRIPEGNQTVVVDPETSKAYYSKLVGQPQVYSISSAVPFSLYVNILVPDIAGQKKDVSATILKDGNQLAVLDGLNFEWKQFFEPFGYDTYWEGPEYKARAEAGNYEIIVSSPANDSKYSIAIGEAENFDFKESLNALKLIPQIKRSFFNESPAGFIRSPFGWGLILIMFMLSFVFGFVYRWLLKRLARNSVRKVHKNIGTKDRSLRLVIGLTLFVWAITTSWNPILLFLAGFAFFEAIFSWCGVYAALGKNTCPL